MAIVADFESYPQWNNEVKTVCALLKKGSAHKTGGGSASDIDSGNRGLEGAMTSELSATG
jgi:hypothetical protein